MSQAQVLPYSFLVLLVLRVLLLDSAVQVLQVVVLLAPVLPLASALVLLYSSVLQVVLLLLARVRLRLLVQFLLSQVLRLLLRFVALTHLVMVRAVLTLQTGR